MLKTPAAATVRISPYICKPCLRATASHLPEEPDGRGVLLVAAVVSRDLLQGLMRESNQK
eukprot:scaffold408572_cov19-Prasinocladus_malaysianus.AAC.1